MGRPHAPAAARAEACDPTGFPADAPDVLDTGPPAFGPEMSSPSSVEPLVRPQMPELDSVRGAAVLMVLLYHALFWSNPGEHPSRVVRVLLQASQPGWIGVDLFFVLSGFLITGILLSGRERPDYYRRFYRRRALRILPAHFALLTVLVLSEVIQGPFAALSAVFLANMVAFFGVPMQYGPLWSLAVEEHFYLVWPAAVRRLSVRGLALCALGIVVASPILRWVAFRRAPGADLYDRTWFRLDGLAMGALLAMAVRHEAATRRRVAAAALAALAAGATVAVVGLPYGIGTRLRPLGAALQFSIISLCCLGVLAGAVVVGTGRHRRLVRSRVLRFFGAISYGLYLVHLLLFDACDRLASIVAPTPGGAVRSPLAIVLRVLVAGGAAVALAWLSRRYFEEWFLRLKAGADAPAADEKLAGASASIAG